MTDKIYLITRLYRDIDNYRCAEIAEEYGFFESQEEVEAWIDDQHNYQAKYDYLVRSIEAGNIVAEDNFVARRKRWEEAKAAGFGDLMNEPKRSQSRNVPTWEEFLRGQEDSFGFTEVDRG